MKPVWQRELAAILTRRSCSFRLETGVGISFLGRVCGTVVLFVRVFLRDMIF